MQTPTVHLPVISLGPILMPGAYMTQVIQRLRLALSKGPNRVGVSPPLPSLENGSRSSFRNVVFTGT
jgi:hypothetical protein